VLPFLRSSSLQHSLHPSLNGSNKRTVCSGCAWSQAEEAKKKEREMNERD
jgi:hypothetical protein